MATFRFWIDAFRASFVFFLLGIIQIQRNWIHHQENYFECSFLVNRLHADPNYFYQESERLQVISIVNLRLIYH